MLLKRYFIQAIVVFIAFGIFSCVKDVDFDQAENIALEPRLQVDLIIFDIDEGDFIDPKTLESKSIIRDTVRLEFLDDDYIQNNLKEVEFSFRYTNSFPQVFSNKISFLSENNSTQHSVSFYIAGGSADDPSVTENIELIEEDRIEKIKRSIKMVVEVEVLPGPKSFNGNLQFASKGLFSLEF